MPCPRVCTFVGAAALLALAGCAETVAVESGAEAGAPGNAAEAAARQACLRDVRAATGNADVSVTSSSFSEAGTEVNLAVGPTGTWRCVGYGDGTTAEIMSTTDEGAL